MIFDKLVGTKPKLEVYAKVYRACTKCGHSGMINNKYHEDFCPKCGEKRPPIEDKGLIYSSTRWWHFKRKVRKLFGKE